ncbi:adenine-specific DNA-methyltransferase [Parabacteroides sp. PF5-5]|uniref:Eco57I restriction-modification methylase domain-containing protein n=1 Tax=unclassified Parabacteroides TaxID=2649774 RepID=UPI002473A93F|nr:MULTISPECIES: N-6 DNA methylase [unclassified Parabacteroides]MDH6304213.1 adenine-specific DNA-methyltransferase [Parabacteroides sp. PH5-39]MDH6315072.1 adenine-specific DNA-methyltransferase [Parabacteroides sp. PF5-13]MDH6318732.1 adenine-specific DNA-methyltransferase [Parabacteroides sp. PH5-13]MDH6322462.1 adenine-specific DNA-methyltransferase [Parabacteroides sp. PH5-8]MDH6326403.1 adenine-specific DNA-methyltransferase [Parabacteroides sp. PH5-41]
MTQQELKKAYNRQDWHIWLQDIFGSQVQFETQAEKIEIDKEQLKSIHRFASIKLADGKNLAVLDIETQASVQIARNRIGLNKSLVKLIDHARYHGILAFYHSEDKSQTQYRLSFISSEPTIDANGNFSIENTPPKRFTYVLGENEKTKTPADRLKMIADKRGNTSLEDIKNAFSVETLTKEFYNELSNWYFWALQNVVFPDDLDKLKLIKIDVDKRNDEEKKLTELRNSTSVIRLITRLMFVWFLKQKNLIKDELFNTQELDKILNYNDKTGSTFYKAILQNLFFATLNTEMSDKRKFVNRQAGIQGFYRYERFFKNKERFIELTKDIPFLNGGLFENLDKNVGEENEIRIDCFSNRPSKELLLKVPDFLFFSEEETVDLNKFYDTKGKNYKVRGLIDILKTYNFTIEENTPTDVEVALDPELLGKVFENLLASFNPETQTTARKQTGSFYTPREIVDYMVNESLAAYLQEKVGDDWENNIRTISALNDVKILDPACGSGAFPMGILLRMVQILQKLDPKNELWKQRQLDIAGKIEDERAREAAINNIEEAFENNALDYGRKLFLIENCIFGIDIQPIAVQISKLRFFISLICEQTPNPEKPNLGIRPLPNLETKFVAANTLIGLEKPKQRALGMDLIDPLEEQLATVRHKHFSARTPDTKRKYRDRDYELRTKIAEKLKEIGFSNDTAEKIAAWNPYDQNDYARWFDAEWMFDVKDGFDIVIGNPPYKQVSKGVYSKELFPYSEGKDKGKQNLYKLFVEASYNLAKENGFATMIVQSSLMCDLSSQFTRELLLTKTEIDEVIEFPKIAPTKNGQVFESVLQGTCIYRFKRKIPNSDRLFKVSIGNDVMTIFSMIYESISQRKILDFYPNGFFIPLVKAGEFEIVSKMQRISIPLKTIITEVSQGDLNLTISKSHIVNYKTDTILLRGRNISKFYIDYSVDEYVKQDFKKENLEKNATNHYIVCQEVTGTVDKWRLHFAVTDIKKSFLFGHTVNKILLKNQKDNLFVLGILNSKLLDWYFRKTSSNNHVGGYEIEQLPIKSTNIKQSIISIVNYLLYLKNKENSVVSEIGSNEIIASYFEKVVDACVYELYFEEEIKQQQVDVLELIGQSIDKVADLPIEQQIIRLFEEWNDYKNEVRNRIILQETRSESVAQIIKSMN